MKDAYYFPHDANAHNDPKIIGLRLRCEWAGVGIFWSLIEILRDSPGYKYLNDLATLELGLSTPQATLEATLKACFELGLLVENDGFFSSPSLNRRMAEIDKKRDKLRDAGRRGGLKSSLAKGRLKPGLSHPQAGKESKVKESKEKEYVEHFEIFWNQYPRKTAKHKAREEWNKIKDIEAVFETIQGAVSVQKNTKQWQEGFIPHASTWLHQKRWEDEIFIDTNKLEDQDTWKTNNAKFREELEAKRRMDSTKPSQKMEPIGLNTI